MVRHFIGAPARRTFDVAGQQLPALPLSPQPDLDRLPLSVGVAGLPRIHFQRQRSVANVLHLIHSVGLRNRSAHRVAQRASAFLVAEPDTARLLGLSDGGRLAPELAASGLYGNPS
jgi:hypothetical protein